MGTISRIRLGMQCFWGAEAHFGWMSGVVTTRVGYAGGSTPNPSYRNLGDHIEVVDVEYDESKISVPKLLDYFFRNHDSSVRYKRQYISAILVLNSGQLSKVKNYMDEKVKHPCQTEVAESSAFYEAEDYHQKYFLRKHKSLFKELGLNNRQLIDSPIATKLNAYCAGFGPFDEFDAFLVKQRLALSKESLDYLKERIREGPLLSECGI